MILPLIVISLLKLRLHCKSDNLRMRMRRIAFPGGLAKSENMENKVGLLLNSKTFQIASKQILRNISLPCLLE